MSCGDLHALRYHAINTYALKYGAVIYMLSFTCQSLLAAHSGTLWLQPEGVKLGISKIANYNSSWMMTLIVAKSLTVDPYNC